MRRLIGRWSLPFLLILSVASPAGAQTGVSITYVTQAYGATRTVCLGESTNISVLIDRVVRRGSSTVTGQVWGGRVIGVISNESIGHFEPADAGRTVVGPPGEERALFKFVADRSGRTTIEFTTVETGDEGTLGSGWPIRDAVIEIQVLPCFQAHTSGLGSIFVEDDMGSLDEWFLLTAYTPNTRGIETETQVMFFIPNPGFPYQGHYVFVDTVTTTFQQQGSCTSYAAGRYEVLFYIPPDQPLPTGADIGDLLMYGAGTLICQGRPVLNFDYGSSPGFQISFKPKPAR